MKSILFITITLLCSYSFGQLGAPQVTYDPTNASNMAQQISTSTKQLSEMQKTVDYLQSAQDKLNNVSGFVQNLDEAKDIISNYKSALNYANRVPNRLSKMSNKAKANEVSKSVVSMVNKINSSILFTQRLLTNGGFQMTDYERITLLREELSKSRILKTKLKNLAE